MKKLLRLSAVALLALPQVLVADTATPVTRRPLSQPDAVSRLIRRPVAPPQRVKKNSPVMYAPAREFSFMASEVANHDALVQVDCTSPIGFTRLAEDVTASGGGTLADGTYYYIRQISGSILSFTSLDATTWEQNWSYIVHGYDCFAHDMTYDAQDNKIYGCFMSTDDEGNTGYVWGTLRTDPTDLGRDAIADMDLALAAVASDGNGSIYGLDYEGVLYSIAKNTGELTRLADTGLKSELATGGVIDPRSELMYYVTQTYDDKPLLYTIAIPTGETTVIGEFGDYQQLRGMFLPEPEAADDAPAAVQKIDFQFREDALMGMAVITMPAETYGGENMYGQLQYKVYIDGNDYNSGTTYCGDMVYEFLEIPAPGMHTIGVRTSNAAGESPLYEVSRWFGLDELSPLRQVAMERDGNNVKLSWDAPAAAHGGFVDPKKISYDVVRLPEETVVATGLTECSYTDAIPENGSLGLLRWRVDVRYDGTTVSSATTDAIRTGSEIVPPFHASFDSADELSLFTVIDANNDGLTWKYANFYDVNQCLVLESSNTLAGNDYLVTAPVRMKGATQYKVSFKASCYLEWCPERIELLWGTGPEVAELTHTLVPPTDVTTTSANSSRTSAIFCPESDGLYYFALHGISDPYQFYLIVDDFAITESTGLAPGTATDAVVTPAPKGGESVTISFVTPTLTENGAPLTELTKVKVSRNGTLLREFDNPGTGQKIEFTDDDVMTGTYTYSIVCVNSYDEGAAVSLQTYVGMDSPTRVKNIQIEMNADGTQHITWDCPTTGENGGYVDPESIVYTVARYMADGGTLTTLDRVYTTEYTDNFTADKQTVYAYTIRAANDYGPGYWADSHSLIIGGAFSYPFMESAADGYTANPLWLSESEGTKGCWYTASQGPSFGCSPQDYDNGMFEFVPELDGDMARLTSGNIDMTQATHPVLEFWYYADGNGRLEVQASIDNSDWQTLAAYDMPQAQQKGWTKARVDLTPAADASTLRLGFLGCAPSVADYLYIDNISVYEAHNLNLGLQSAEFPGEAAVGTRMTARAIIENTGLLTVDKARVELYRNEELVDEALIGGIESGATTTVELSDAVDPTFPAKVTYVVSIVLNGDGEQADNELFYNVEIVHNYDFPAPTALTARLSENGTDAVLSWTAPQAYDGTLEDFEAYEPFGYSQNIGSWKSIDRNGSEKIVPVENGKPLDFASAGLGVGFQVFDVSLPGTKSTDLAGYESDRALVTFASKIGLNADWLISPVIRGGTELSFMARSGSRFFKERFELMYSTDERSPENFSILGEPYEVGDSWTEIKATLPADARYFAVVCTSYDCYALVIDNIRYISKAADAVLTGYNIYRNGVLAATATETAATVPAGDDKAEFTVSAVYDLGESPFSNRAMIESSSVGEISRAVKVYGVAGTIVIEGADGQRATIHTPDGRTLFSAIAGQRETIQLASGIYIVTIGSESWKLII